MRLKSLLLILLMILVLGLIIGCSSDSADSDEGGTDESATTETSAAEEEPADDATEDDETDEGAASDGSSVGDVEDEVFRQQLRSMGLTRLDEGPEFVFEWDFDTVEMDKVLCSEIAGGGYGVNLEGPNSEFVFGFHLNSDGSINTNESSIYFEIDGEGYSSLGPEAWEFVYAEEEGPVVYGEAELKNSPGADAFSGYAGFYIGCGDQ